MICESSLLIPPVKLSATISLPRLFFYEQAFFISIRGIIFSVVGGRGPVWEPTREVSDVKAWHCGLEDTKKGRREVICAKLDHVRVSAFRSGSYYFSNKN